MHGSLIAVRHVSIFLNQLLAIDVSIKQIYFAARHFITRALLSVENFYQAQQILRDSGVGAADGCSINMTFLK